MARGQLISDQLRRIEDRARLIRRVAGHGTLECSTKHASDELDDEVLAFEEGLVVETGEGVPSPENVVWMREIPGLREAIRQLGAFDVTDGAEEPSVVASAVEFIFEGLHLSRRINKDRAGTGTVYRR